jgi:hypothetical protein
MGTSSDDIKLIVRGFYQEILNREPDPSGARTYEELLSREGVPQGVLKMLRSALNSKEYRRRIEATVQPDATLSARSDRLIAERPVAHIASLGPYCLASQVLKDNGLKRYSLPFDWMFSNPRIVMDCLADDFAALLDRSYYASTSHVRTPSSADHLLFLQRYRRNHVFAHRDPTRDEDYEYVVRCVERFRSLLRSDDGKIFLMLGHPGHGLPELFSELIGALERTTKNFALLAVEILDEQPGTMSLTTLATVGEHALYQFIPRSRYKMDVKYRDKLDDLTLLQLIHRYNLALVTSI